MQIRSVYPRLFEPPVLFFTLSQAYGATKGSASTITQMNVTVLPLASNMPVQQFHRLPVLPHRIKSLDLGHVHQIGRFMFGWFFSQSIQGR